MSYLLSLFWYYWLGIGKGIWSVKILLNDLHSAEIFQETLWRLLAPPDKPNVVLYCVLLMLLPLLVYRPKEHLVYNLFKLNFEMLIEIWVLACLQ